MSVDDIEAATRRCEELGCSWLVKFGLGVTPGYAYMYTPDGHVIEFLQNTAFPGKEEYYIEIERQLAVGSHGYIEGKAVA